jgi:Myb/SANT-like DNA-binding domain
MAEPVTVVKEATRVSWNDTYRRHFVNAMMNEAAKGTFVDNGFKKQSWHSTMLEFISTSGCKYDKQQLHSHCGVLERKYNIYNALINNSGFGPTAADEVWSAYLKAHPDASEFRGKPFVLFDDLDSMFTGKVATGKYSKSSMTPFPAAIPREKRQRGSSGDESWLKGGNDEDANDESDDSSDDIPVRNAARAVAAPEKEVKPVPVRPVRSKPGSEIAGFLGKIVDNHERIVKHNMADSKLD